MSSRWAWVMSVALHLGLGVWLSTRRVPPPEPTRAPFSLEAVTVEVELEPEPPAPEPRTPEPLEPQRKKKKARAEAASPSEPTGVKDLVDDRPTADRPADDAPRAVGIVSLVPSTVNLPDGVAVERPRGETLRPDDPRFSKAFQDAQAKARVTARVDAFAEDVLADARATRGLPHPYFTAVAATARASLAKQARQEGFKPSAAAAAQAYARKVNEATSSYGATGTAETGPIGQAPRLSEKLTQPDQAPMRALAQATELMQDFTSGTPLRSLTLEMIQTKDDQPPELRVVKSSGDPRFDDFVLRSWLQAMRDATHPPPDAFRKPTLRTVWEVEGWLKSKDDLSSMLPGLMGVPTGQLVQLASGDAKFDFHAKLLRAY